MANAERGYNCVLTIAGQIVGAARGVNVTVNIDDIDTTARSDNGWRDRLDGLKDLQASCETVWCPTDAALEAILTAALAGTKVTFSIVDSQGDGWSGNCRIFNLTRPEPIDGALILGFDLKSCGVVTRLNPAS